MSHHGNACRRKRLLREQKIREEAIKEVIAFLEQGAPIAAKWVREQFLINHKEVQ